MTALTSIPIVHFTIESSATASVLACGISKLCLSALYSSRLLRTSNDVLVSGACKPL